MYSFSKLDFTFQERMGTCIQVLERQGPGQAIPKYCKMAYWLLWIKGTWQTASARRAHWPSSVSLNERNKSPLWKVPSLPHPYHENSETEGQKACINKACYSFTNLRAPSPLSV